MRESGLKVFQELLYCVILSFLHHEVVWGHYIKSYYIVKQNVWKCFEEMRQFCQERKRCCIKAQHLEKISVFKIDCEQYFTWRGIYALHINGIIWSFIFSWDKACMWNIFLFILKLLCLLFYCNSKLNMVSLC